MKLSVAVRLFALLVAIWVAAARDASAAVFSFSRTEYSVGEAGGNAVLTVTLDRSNDPDPGGEYTVRFKTVDDGSASSSGAGRDYDSVEGTLTFGPGVNSQSFTVPILDDATTEETEDFSAIIFDPQPQCIRAETDPPCYYQTPTFRNASARVLIFDNDRSNTVQFEPSTYRTGEAGPGGVPGQATLTVTASRFGDPNTTITVQYATSNGSASAGTDYNAKSGSVTFGPGETQKQITVDLINDGLIEETEDFRVELSSPSGAVFGTGARRATVNIVDDDGGTSVIQFSASTYTAPETAGAATLRIVRSGGIGFAVSVNYATADGTAKASTDYAAQAGTVSFAPGEYEKEVTIGIVNDSDVEPTENFSVSLSSPSANGALGEPKIASVNINDDDAGNTIQFNPTVYNGSEVGGDGQPGRVVLTVSATRTGDPTTVLQVQYLTRSNTATSNQDYHFTAGTVTFNAGETQKQITIQLINDTLIEQLESFFVDLSNPSNASLGSAATATVNIADDDGGTSAIQFSADSYSAGEGDGSATLTVVRSGGIGFAVSADYTTANGTATAGQDYTETSGTVSFAPGEYTRTITVPILQDSTTESSEDFSATLSNPSPNATIGGRATTTVIILDDEGPPVITSPRTASGQRGQPFSYRITATNNPTSFAAEGLPSGLSIDTSSGLISGTPNDFGTFEVQISATNIHGTGSALLTLSIASGETTVVQFRDELYTVTNPQSTVTLIVDLARAGGDNGSFRVDYTTEDGSAKAAQDYEPQSGTLFFASGEKQKTITIAVNPQNAPHAERTFFVHLFNPSHGAVGRSRATVVISYPDVSTKLLNISTRAPVRTGEDVMIAGFIVQGTAPKRVVLRAIGPSLTALGVPGAIADPTLTLMDSNGSQIGFNDNYDSNSAEDRRTLNDHGLTPSDTRESAVVATIAPGQYTTILRGKTNGAGLVEVYDISGTNASRFVNISTRSRVGEGDNGAMIAGFIIAAPPQQAGSPQRMLVRALGPSLGETGISDTLENPKLDIYRGSELIMSNDDWKSDQRQALQASGVAPKKDREAAIIADLEPGSYSAVVRGVGSNTGVALVELYQLSQ